MRALLSGPLGSIEQNKLAQIMRTLLDRYPIIVVGDSSEPIDLVTETLISLVPHRREYVFGSDFITSTEHEQIINHENSDYNSERIIFRAPSSASAAVPNRIQSFKGWVIASNTGSFEEIYNAMKALAKVLVVIKLQNGDLTVELNGGKNTLADTSFEQKLLEKVVSETRVKIERIKRVLRRTAQGKVSERLEKSLIDLQHEEERIRQSLFKEQILAFVQAAWRTLIILLRLRLLEGVGVKSVISEKILREAIDYKSATISRLMDFINAEWGEDFRHSVEGGRKRSFGDRLEGSWTI